MKAKPLLLYFFASMLLSCETTPIETGAMPEGNTAQLAKDISWIIGNAIQEEPALSQQFIQSLELRYDQSLNDWNDGMEAVLEISTEQKGLIGHRSASSPFNYLSIQESLVQIEESSGDKMVVYVPYAHMVDWELDWYIAWGEENEEGLLGYQILEDELVEVVISEEMAQQSPVLVVQPHPPGGDVTHRMPETVVTTVEHKDNPGARQESVMWAYFDLIKLKTGSERFSFADRYSEVRIYGRYVRYNAQYNRWFMATPVQTAVFDNPIEVHQNQIGDILSTPEIPIVGDSQYGDFSQDPLWLLVYEHDWWATTKEVRFVQPNGQVYDAMKFEFKTELDNGILFSGHSPSLLISSPSYTYGQYFSNIYTDFYIVNRPGN